MTTRRISTSVTLYVSEFDPAEIVRSRQGKIPQVAKRQSDLAFRGARVRIADQLAGFPNCRNAGAFDAHDRAQ